MRAAPRPCRIPPQQPQHHRGADDVGPGVVEDEGQAGDGERALVPPRQAGAEVPDVRGRQRDDADDAAEQRRQERRPLEADEQQARRVHEHERDQRLAHRQPERGEAGAHRLRSRDAGRRVGRERDRRRHVGQHAVVEDEEVGGDERHAERPQRRRGDRGEDDVGGRGRDARAHQDARDRHEQEAEEDLGTVLGHEAGGVDGAHELGDGRGEFHDRAGELEAQPRQRQRAEDQAHAGAGGTDRERVLGALFQSFDQRLPGQRLALQPAPAEPARHPRDVRAADAQHDAPERRQERREVEQQHRHQRDQRKDQVPALADDVPDLRDEVRLDTLELQPLGLEVHHREAGEVVEQRRNDGDEHQFLVGHAEQLGHDERRGAHHRRRHLPAAGRGRLDAAGEAGGEAVLLHQRNGERAGGDGVGHGRAGDHPEQARGHDADLRRAAGEAAGDDGREIHEQPSEAGHLRQHAEQNEVEDVGRDDADRDAVDAFGADVDVVDDADGAVAAVRQDTRHVAAEQRVEQAGHADDGQQRPHRAARRLHHHDDREHAHHVVLRDRRPDALDEDVVEEDQEVQRHRRRGQRERPVDAGDAVPVAAEQRQRQREQRDHGDQPDERPVVAGVAGSGQVGDERPREVQVERGEGAAPQPGPDRELGVGGQARPREHQEDEPQHQRQVKRPVLDLDQQAEARRVDVEGRQHHRDRGDQQRGRPDQLAEVRLGVELADQLRLLFGGDRLDAFGDRAAVRRLGLGGHRGCTPGEVGRCRRFRATADRRRRASRARAPGCPTARAGRRGPRRPAAATGRRGRASRCRPAGAACARRTARRGAPSRPRRPPRWAGRGRAARSGCRSARGPRPSRGTSPRPACASPSGRRSARTPDPAPAARTRRAPAPRGGRRARRRRRSRRRGSAGRTARRRCARQRRDTTTRAARPDRGLRHRGRERASAPGAGIT